MRRRTLLQSLIPLSVQAQNNPATADAAALQKPRALQPGDTIGLITPATSVTRPEDLQLAERTLRHFGLQPKFAPNVTKKAGYLGGTVAQRVEDLHAMFADPSVAGIFCLRGGYGSGQLLDRINYALIRSHPKVLLGYSDITALHLALHRHAGLVTFHGPVVLSKYSPYTQQHFRRALFEAKPLGTLTNPPEPETLRPRHLLRAVRPGRASGPLVGGNLSLVVALLGTPYEIDTRGKILFLEDVGEQPYSLDRMLTSLRLAGKLQQAAGIIWGECNDCGPRDYKPSFDATFSESEVAQQILGELAVPVLAGLTIGHTDDQLTLPLGVQATLDADKGELSIDEAATIPPPAV